MVATVRELRSTSTTVDYYAADGYYAKDDPEHRRASFWHGETALAVGLRGHVKPEEFESVLSGHVPRADVRLGRKRDDEHVHRPGWDITLSAPKSVSLEALVRGDRRVIRAHDQAVYETLDWIEKELLETRGWDPATQERPRIAAHGMAVAGFRHLTSRDLDPQLHTHCILANMTRNGAGDWRSVEPTMLRRNEKLIGAYYRNELASRLVGLGIALAPRLIGRVPGFELAGYDRDHLDAFSGRRREILRFLDERNLPHTAAATQMAALHTRRRKTEAGLAELVPAWRERAVSLGLQCEPAALRPRRPIDPETGKKFPMPKAVIVKHPKNEIRRRQRAPALPGIPMPVKPSRSKGAIRHRPGLAPVRLLGTPERSLVDVVARAVAHMEERRTVIPRGEIRAIALGHAPGRYRLEEIDATIERLCREGELVETKSRGPDTAYVTDRAIRAERRMLATMRAGQGKAQPLADVETAEAQRALSRLTAGQQDAVRLILLSRDTVVGVQGHAGTGKTTMLKTAASVLGGRRIVGLAPSSAAVRVLSREAGIEARTLQSFLLRYGNLSDPAHLTRARRDFAGTVLAVDESSMIATVQMEALLGIAKTLGVARVVLTGDTKQLRAVDAGQPFRVLQKAGMATATMDQVLRQRDPELLAAVTAARSDDPGGAIAGLGNRVYEAPPDQLGRTAAEHWLALPQAERERTAVLAPTHLIRGDINRTVRAGLLDEGVLRGEALVIERLINQRLTRVEAANPTSYQPGDVVVFHRDVYGCSAHDICTVVGVDGDGVELAHPDGKPRRFRPSGNAARNLGVYDTEEIEIRAGDRIRWTRNRKAPPARFGREPAPDLVNGEQATVAEIGRHSVRFQTDDGRTYSISRIDPQLRHIDHAYSTTVHGAQGMTSPRVIAVLEAGGRADQDLLYVEISRASRDFELVVDDRELLAERLAERPGIDEGALEAIGASLAPPVVDPDLFAGLQADWRSLQRRADAAGRVSYLVGGYGEVVAQIAALDVIEDLPADMRGFVDTVLAEHTAQQQRDDKIRGLAESLDGHWRQWPELCWQAASLGVAPEALDEHRQWRGEGDRLVNEARDLLVNRGEDGCHLAAMDGVRSGLDSSLAQIEKVRTAADLARFERAWTSIVLDASSTGVPEIHLPGYHDVAEIGERLAGVEWLDDGQRRTIADWQKVDRLQSELTAQIVTLPNEAAALVERAGDGFAQASGNAENVPDAAWKNECQTLADECRAMLDPDSDHAPHLDAMAGARDRVREAGNSLETAMLDMDIASFHRRARVVTVWTGETGGLEIHAPDYPELRRQADALHERSGVPAVDRETIMEWMDADAQTRLERVRVGALVKEIGALDREWQRMVTAAGENGEAESGSAAVSDAWQKKAELALRDAGQLADDFSPATLDAHAHAASTTGEGLDREIEKLRQRLAETSMLRELAAWMSRLNVFLVDEEQLPHDFVSPRCRAWRERGDALVTQGRSILGRFDESAFVAFPLVRDSVASGIEEIEKVLLARELPAFQRLDGRIRTESRISGEMAFDHSVYPTLIALSRTLKRRHGAPAETRVAALEWLDRDVDWEKARTEIGKFVELIGRIDGQRREHAGGCVEAGRLLPAPPPLREKCQWICDTVKRLEGKVDAGERTAHIRAAGKDLESFDAVVREIHNWLTEDDVARTMANRDNHIEALRANHDTLCGPPGEDAPTVPWYRNEPLVPGDRLRWTDTSGAEPQNLEAIVLSISAGNRPGEVGSITVEKPGYSARAAHGPGRPVTFESQDLNYLTENCGCQRVRWPDESVRRLEWTRQMPKPDAVYSIDCAGSLVPGDRIRVNLGSGSGGHWDAPLIEAVVEKIEIARESAKDAVTLRVTASWSSGDPLAPGTLITKERSTLSARGVYRAPWTDEGQRADRENEFAAQERRQRKSLSQGNHGISM